MSLSDSSVSRRRLLQLGGAAAAAGLTAPLRQGAAAAAGLDLAPLRRPDSLPDPTRPAGTADPRLPFEHIVIVMQENHSFDNYFGMLPRRGQPRADGFFFDPKGRPWNFNPTTGGYLRAFHHAGPCQSDGITQAWNSTHRQINGGQMDGFVATSGPDAMGYLDEADIPFYYSLAKTFTLGNRWFCSAPCQTYPNRRFLMAGTAYGLISTDTNSIGDPPPRNGTIWDRLSGAGLSWKNYFVDLPSTGIISSTIEKHPSHLAPLSQFHLDCATGNLPAVSLVDPDFNLTDTALGAAQSLPGVKEVEAQLGPRGAALLQFIRAQGASEENPTNVNFGEAFVAAVVDAVMHGPAWPRTLLVWTYDEHGGYYDHVVPPAAIPPDNIPPRLKPGDAPGGYDMYGPRVPTVVVSPHSRPNGVTNVVHDHTSILATIEAKWNLPALTYRDANAATLEDFLDLTHPAFLHPPTLAAPGDIVRGDLDCRSTQHPPVVSSPTAPFPEDQPGDGPSASPPSSPATPLAPLTGAATKLLGKLGF
jgi:phospholipase C